MKPWAKSLQIEPDEYNSWMAEIRNDVSITFWALSNHKLPSEVYLAWAREHYGLASLNSEFFTQQSNKTWNMMKDVTRWSVEMVPVALWDNTVFIACVEVPSGKKAETIPSWNFNYQFLLANHEDLQSYWNRLHSEEVTVVTTTNNSSETMNQTVESSPDLTNPPPQPITQVTLTLKDEDEAGNEINDSLPPAPEGLNITPQERNDAPSPHTLILQDEDFLQKPAPSESANDNSDIEMPEGLTLVLSGDEFKNKTDETPEEVLPTNSKVFEGPTDPTPPIPEISIVEANAKEQTSEETRIADGHAIFNSAEDLTTTLTSNNKPTPTKKALPLIKSDAITPSSLESARTETEVANFFFHNADKKLESMMILLKEGEYIKPWLWHGFWANLDLEEVKSLPLSQPSIFRIVKRSNLPFCGQISPSEINDSFLTQWGHEHFNGNAIVCPISYDGFLVGMALLLMTSTDPVDLDLLAKTEKSVEKMSMALQAISKAS